MHLKLSEGLIIVFLSVQYDTKGKLSHGAFSKLLVDVGIRMARSDVDKCFSYFDVDYSSTVSRLEYANILTLTDYEIDLAVDRIRLKLLAAIPTDMVAASAMVSEVVSTELVHSATDKLLHVQLLTFIFSADNASKTRRFRFETDGGCAGRRYDNRQGRVQGRLPEDS